MDTVLLEILRCPITGQRLEIASADDLARFEVLHVAGSLRARSGDLVVEKIEAALLNAERTVLYRIESGIPILLPDEAISLP